MLDYQYHYVLLKLAKETFPDKKILPFKIKVHAKEMKTRHGDYMPSERTIRIFNLSRNVQYVIKTALHELAHHCEYSIYGETGHSKRFYEVFKQLLEVAIPYGIVDYDVLRTQQDSNDIKMLEKHFGYMDTVAKTTVPMEGHVVKVANSYPIKDALSGNKYFYNGVERMWCKIIETDEALEQEKEWLRGYTNESNISVNPVFDLTFKAVYYMFVTGGFDVKDTLKENGYFYKKWKKKSGWAKKIEAPVLNEEKQFLHQLNVTKYEVVSSFA